MRIYSYGTIQGFYSVLHSVRQLRIIEMDNTSLMKFHILKFKAFQRDKSCSKLDTLDTKQF